MRRLRAALGLYLDLELVAATPVGWYCVGGPRKDVPLPAGRCRCKACPALAYELYPAICGVEFVRCTPPAQVVRHPCACAPYPAR